MLLPSKHHQVAGQLAIAPLVVYLAALCAQEAFIHNGYFYVPWQRSASYELYTFDSMPFSKLHTHLMLECHVAKIA